MTTNYTPKLVGKVPLTVYRKAAGSYDQYGRWVEGTESSFVWTANVQKLKPYEKQLLPEADRSREHILCLGVYSNPPRSLKEANWSADEILWQGERYEVLSVELWRMGVLNHAEVRAARIDRTG